MITVESARANTQQMLKLYNIFSKEEKSLEELKEENVEKGRKAFERQGIDIADADRGRN